MLILKLLGVALLSGLLRFGELTIEFYFVSARQRRKGLLAGAWASSRVDLTRGAASTPRAAETNVHVWLLHIVWQPHSAMRPFRVNVGLQYPPLGVVRRRPDTGPATSVACRAWSVECRGSSALLYQQCHGELGR